MFKNLMNCSDIWCFCSWCYCTQRTHTLKNGDDNCVFNLSGGWGGVENLCLFWFKIQQRELWILSPTAQSLPHGPKFWANFWDSRVNPLRGVQKNFIYRGFLGPPLNPILYVNFGQNTTDQFLLLVVKNKINDLKFKVILMNAFV